MGKFTQSLNNRRLPESLNVAKAGTSVLDLTYSYDKRGKITQQINGTAPGQTRTYGYDPQGRLITANSPAWGTASYNYDALGNLRSKNFTHWPIAGSGTSTRTITNSYDDYKNRVTASNDNGAVRTVGYDSRGNVTTLGQLAFLYDRSDQPTVVTGAANGNYVYDGNLKRVKSVIDGKTIYNVYDAAGALIHVDEATDGKETDYLHGMGQTLARIKNDEFTYLHPDHLGSAQVGTHGTTGAALWSEHYTPFGEALVGAAANDNQAGFTGHIKDKATGLNYMQARYYDPNIGRFLSIDPVGFMETGNPNFFNRYAYTFNDPINLTDPSGMCAEDGKSGFCPQNEQAQKMFDQQMKDTNSSLPQAEKDAIKSGTFIAVTGNEDFGGSSVGPNSTPDGDEIPNSYGLSFAKQKGVFENSDGSISEQDSSPTEVFEHEVGHIVDIMSGAPLTDRTVDTIGFPDRPNEVSAINRTNTYRRNTGGPNARQRVCHSCSVGNANIWKKYGSP